VFYTACFINLRHSVTVRSRSSIHFWNGFFLYCRIHIGCGVDPTNLMVTSSPFPDSKSAVVVNFYLLK
jgi:hypothetical protein